MKIGAPLKLSHLQYILGMNNCVKVSIKVIYSLDTNFYHALTASLTYVMKSVQGDGMHLGQGQSFCEVSSKSTLTDWLPIHISGDRHLVRLIPTCTYRITGIFCG